MRGTTDFIAKLVQAANAAQKPGNYERRRLLEQALIIIRDMRRMVGAPDNAEAELVLDIHAAEVMLLTGQATEERVRTALLTAAQIIRELDIQLRRDG